jgi:hypothetical protein
MRSTIIRTSCRTVALGIYILVFIHKATDPVMPKKLRFTDFFSATFQKLSMKHLAFPQAWCRNTQCDQKKKISHEWFYHTDIKENM